jgi:glycosyltransferase involved in cell wall biosynthesis
LHLAYNGVDIARFRPEGARAALPWPELRLVIGVVCALRPEKGLFTLLEAFAQIRPRYPEARLLIVGSGPVGERVKQRAGELGLGRVCHFEPAAEEVTPWLRAMDIFVLPSLSEALSNALMEAMACGCCAVASEVGGNPELVAHGETGMLFPAGDHRALAAVLDSLAGRPEVRRRLAAAGGAFIRGGFSSQAAARRMGQIYADRLSIYQSIF